MPRQERRPRPEAAAKLPTASGPAADPLLVVGRVNGAYGVKGWLRVSSFTDPPENLERYRPWYLHRAGGWESASVEAIEPHGKGWVVQLAGVADRDAAERLAGTEIGVPSSVLPPAGPDEYYWKDLIGLDVVTVAGVPLGRVDRLLATGAHDVLVVTPPGSGTAAGPTAPAERLIPFVGAFVIEVDVDRGQVLVDWAAEEEG